MRTKYRKETGEEMDNDLMLTKAITRRAEITEEGKWINRNRVPAFNIGIAGRKNDEEA
jgi:hypothetical protein